MRASAWFWLLCMVGPVSAADPDLVGRMVPPYPEGLKSNTGSCVGSESGEKEVCARSIATLDDAQDRSLQLFAAELVDRVGEEPRWRVTDAVAYPALQPHELVAIATCQRDGVADAGVIAIVDPSAAGAAAQDMLPALRWALRLDRKTGKFMPIAPASVRCYNEGHGE